MLQLRRTHEFSLRLSASAALPQSAGSPRAAVNTARPSSTRTYRPPRQTSGPPSKPPRPETANRKRQTDPSPRSRRTGAPQAPAHRRDRSQPRSWSPWSAPGPHPIENPWSSPGTSGHDQRTTTAGHTAFTAAASDCQAAAGRVRAPHPNGCRGPAALANEAGVTEDGPDPAAEVVPSPPGPSHVQPHRPCPGRALSIGRQRSSTDNHGRSACLQAVASAHPERS
jgi:hypothetical protein